MSEILDYIKQNIFIITIISIVLQISGTLVLALFSFYGLTIEVNKESYTDGVQKTVVNIKWLWAAKFALIVLLLGIILSGVASVASIFVIK